ncbi:MAG TPA: protein-glutamate O-methyltransferase CheR [Stellaceae bacterium]|jgi:chemotaxis protein methyltransferase CheR
MRDDDFDFIARLLKERSGLVLTRDKAYLLESRLLPVARRHEMQTLDALAAALRGRLPTSPLARDVIEAMTTNESFFFRDTKPFDQFRTFVLPQLLAARAATRTLRIWSAACSSGQEPYSLAMILDQEKARLANWRVEIVATDLSTEILDKAKAGSYTQFEVQRGLPIQFLVKYFKQHGDRWEVDAALRSAVQFRQFNLLDDPASLGRFDVIFCRNVLIYFDQPTKSVILERLARILAPDGFLYLGGAETVLGLTDKLQPAADNRGIYVPAATASRAPVKAAV